MEPPKKLLEDDFPFQRAVFFFRIKILTFLWGSTLDDVNDFPSYDDFSKKIFSQMVEWFKWVFLHQMRPKKIRKKNPPTQHIQVRIFTTSKKISPHQTPHHHPIHHQIPHLAACTVGITGGADGAGWLGANGCTACTAAGGTVGATLGAAVGGACGACGAGGRIGICGYAAGGLRRVVERMVVFLVEFPFFDGGFWWIFFICSFLF